MTMKEFFCTNVLKLIAVIKLLKKPGIEHTAPNRPADQNQLALSTQANTRPIRLKG